MAISRIECIVSRSLFCVLSGSFPVFTGGGKVELVAFHVVMWVLLVLPVLFGTGNFWVLRGAHVPRSCFSRVFARSVISLVCAGAAKQPHELRGDLRGRKLGGIIGSMKLDGHDSTLKGLSCAASGTSWKKVSAVGAGFGGFSLFFEVRGKWGVFEGVEWVILGGF